MKASSDARRGEGRAVRLTFNQKCLVALCSSMLLVALTYLVIGILLVGNRVAADNEIAHLLSELDAPISAGVIEGVFQLVLGLCLQPFSASPLPRAASGAVGYNARAQC